MPTAPDESSADLAYRKLRQMLSDGELVPGQRLSQSRLGRQLGCSPMPVVESMRRLESDGLLLKQARKQAIVRKVSERDLEGLYLLREAIESVTARLTALRATPEETQLLQKLAELFERATEASLGNGEADVAIHRHIAACARCPLLNEELDRLLLIERTAGRSFHSEEKQEAHPNCHRALVQAIVDHDADSAEYLMNIFRARMLRSSASSLPKRHSPAGSGEQRRHDAIVDAAEHGDARNLIADGLLAN